MATMQTNVNPIKTRNYAFCEQLYQDMRNEFNCDIVLFLEGWTIKAHRCVLAANSAFFRNLFQNLDLPTNTVFLTEASKKTLRPLMDVMYGRCLDYTKIANKEDLWQIIALADHFQLHHFRNDCIEFARGYPAHGYFGLAYSMSKHLGLAETLNNDIRVCIALSFLPDSKESLDDLGIDYTRVSPELFLDSFQTLEDFCFESAYSYDKHSIRSLEIRARNILNFIGEHPDLDHEAIKNLIEKVKFERLPLRSFDAILNLATEHSPEPIIRNIRIAVIEVLAEIQKQFDTYRLPVMIFDNRGSSVRLGVHGPRIREWTNIHCVVGFVVENYYFDETTLFLGGKNVYRTYNLQDKALSDIKEFPEIYKKLSVSCLALGRGNILYTIGKEPNHNYMSLAVLHLSSEYFFVVSIVQHRASISCMTVRDETIYFVSGDRCFILSYPYGLAITIGMLPLIFLATLSVPSLTVSPKILLAADAKYLHVFGDGYDAQYQSCYTAVKLNPDEALTTAEERILNQKRVVNPSVLMKVTSCCTINDEVMVLCYCKDSHELQLYKYCDVTNEFKPVAFLYDRPISNLEPAFVVLMGQRQ